MKNGIDFESLYKTEFLDKTGRGKNVLGLIFDPYLIVVLYVMITLISLFVGIISSIILPDHIYAPIHDFIDYYLLGFDSVMWYLFVVTAPVIFIISSFVGNHNYRKYALKENTLSPIITAINPTFKYNHKNYIPKEIFKESGIFGESIWSYAGNDLAMGKLGGNYIMFSDLLVKSFARTVFHGQYIVTEFNKEFNGNTVVLTDEAEAIFGKVLGGLIQSAVSGDDLVRMDHPEFEDAFVVHSSDTVEAHYLLTPSMMERILSYKKKTNHFVQLSFFNNAVSVAIAYDKDHFEYLDTSRFTSEAELKKAFDKEFTEPLALATGIIEELRLNEKLWSRR